MHVGQASAPRRHGDQVIDGLPGERLTALGNEQPRQRVGASGEVAFDGSQLVARDRLFDGQTALEAPNP